MIKAAPITDELNQRLDAIPASAQLRLVPIRHHSPACARHLQALIEQDQPEIILIEGPVDATPLLSYLADNDAKPPIALYFYHAEKPANWLAAVEPAGTTRHRGFYPLAEFSPEWVAIRTGAKQGAEVAFIDLPYAHRIPDQVADDSEDSNQPQRDGGESTLLDDQDLANADPTARMVEASGCRDFNEWWDRYYESGGLTLEAESYFRNLLSWCLMLRESRQGESTSAQSENAAREAFMASHVRQAIATGKRIMVVTGGFHTEAIAQQLGLDEPVKPPPKLAGEQGLYIVPYTLGRLDAANGYAAGIANSSYYQQVWQEHRQGQQHPHQAAAEKLALRVSRALQDRGELVSMPDCIEAIAMSRRLASLRGVAPGRAEIIDAMQAAFIKDMHIGDATGRISRLLDFDLKGEVPKRYPAAPLVEDFRNLCALFKLPMGPVDPQEKRLDIYRSERHRQISRLLHRVTFLQVPYAEMTAGPNFAAGEQLQRVREIWQLAWSPETEAMLTERMAYGGQLEEAALNYLLEQLDKNPRESPRLLIEALRMGLHSVLDHVLNRVRHWLDNEGQFPALVEGLKLLVLAHSSQNALAANQLPALTTILEDCFERACLRLSWLGQTDDDDALIYMDALGDLNALAREPLEGEPLEGKDGQDSQPSAGWADVPLFLRCVEGLYSAQVAAPLQGRAAGILSARQVWSHAQTELALTAAFNEALNRPQYLGSYLLGFLPVARAFLAQSPELVRSMDHVVAQWSEEVFLDALPNLRLAFTSLKPRETIALAQCLSALGLTEGLVDNLTDDLAGDKANAQATAWSNQDQHDLKILDQQVTGALRHWGMGQ